MADIKKKILLVEDEKILAEIYKNKFKEAGHKVTSVSEAEKALLLLEKEKPDLIVLDILLPKENGIYFLKKLRENPKTAKITVLAFSNYDDLETKKKARELGVKDYLIKTNHTPREIVKKIKECLYEN